MSNNTRISPVDDPAGSIVDPIPPIKWPALAASNPRLPEDGLAQTVTAVLRTGACRGTVHPPAGAEAGRAALIVTVQPVDAFSATLRISGELDLAVVDVLSEALASQLSAGRRDVRLDLSGLRFCGCSGLDVLLAAHHRFAAAGGTLTLTGLKYSMTRLLRLTGLDQVLVSLPFVRGQSRP